MRGGGKRKKQDKRVISYVLNRLSRWLSGRRARFIHLAFLQRLVRSTSFSFGQHDQIILFIARPLELRGEFQKSRIEFIRPHSLRASVGNHASV